MTARRKWTHHLFVLALLAAFVSAGTIVNAKGKPPKDDPPPPGRIYFSGYIDSAEGFSASMLADGSDWQPSQSGDPSYLPHEGDRWFLRVLSIGEVIAVRETDGFEVQLTNDANMFAGVKGRVRWGKDDSFISFVGRYDADADGVGDEESIFVAGVAFDETGIPSLTETPFPVNTFDLSDDLGWFDWSPDGTQVVYSLGQRLQASDPPPTVIVEDLFGNSLFLDFGRQPKWSPDGNKIAYQRSYVDGGAAAIATIAPDGSGSMDITRPGARVLYDEYPDWSPDSQHVAFERISVSTKRGSSTFFYHILRVPASGGATVNLTKDLGNTSYFRPWGWR